MFCGYKVMRLYMLGVVIHTFRARRDLRVYRVHPLFYFAIKQLNNREVNWVAQGLTITVCLSWDVSPGSLDSKSSTPSTHSVSQESCTIEYYNYYDHPHFAAEKC